MSATGSGGPAGGLFDTLRRTSATLVEIARARVELVTVELEEQRLRAARIAIAAAVTLFFASLALIFATIAVVMAFWDRDPVTVLGTVAAFYGGLGVVAGLLWRAQARARPRLLAQTLAELARDRDELRPP